MPTRYVSAPASLAAAEIMYEFESITSPKDGRDPTSTSSLPVDRTMTRGRGRTVTRSRPSAASKPSCCGPRAAPAPSAGAPAATSSPARRTHSPVRAGRWIATRASPRSVSSSGMTASAPAGIGAPVMIRIASPGPIPERAFAPAATSPITCRCTGDSPLASRVSIARTAYPSIAELSKPGSGKSALMFSASSSPCASSSVSSIVSMEPMPSSTIARCSSTVRAYDPCVWSSAKSRVPSTVLGLILPQPGAEVGSDVGVSDGELNDRLDVVEAVAGVVAAAAERDAVDGHALVAQRLHRVGQLDLAAGARRGFAECREDLRRKHVAADDRERAGCLGGRRFLDEIDDLDDVRMRVAAVGQHHASVLADLCRPHVEQAEDDAAVLGVHLEHRAEQAVPVVDDVVGQ